MEKKDNEEKVCVQKLSFLFPHDGGTEEGGIWKTSLKISSSCFVIPELLCKFVSNS